ncbi:MAG: hypothetical protein M1814_000162 [Vezdaea aestivalis]|nr:MAG: hypothetical protein M1814_000162 [Vezdaea aestivalis]
MASKDTKDAPREEEDDDDYMTMAIPDTGPPKRETYTERYKRKQRESEARGKAKSKKEIAADEAAARDAALSTSIDQTNKGFKMLASMGYKPGQALGKSENARTEPIAMEMKEGRAGIGLDAEKKRKFREEVDLAAKKQKVDQEDYRTRVAREREEKRNEGMMWAAMKIAESMDADGSDENKGKNRETPNLLWRSLVKDRQVKEREKRMRYDLMQSLSRNSNYNDMDEQDSLAIAEEEVELEEDDEELDEFEQLDPAVRLEKLVIHLRDRWHYCFWCKFKYVDTDMEGCPGSKEEDHD